jgi:hypothetical protein
MDPRTGMDNVERRKSLSLPRLELRPIDRPPRSQSLYRLRYPVSPLSLQNENNLFSPLKIGKKR